MGHDVVLDLEKPSKGGRFNGVWRAAKMGYSVVFRVHSGLLEVRLVWVGI